MNNLSLVMIVKDAAFWLPGFISAHEGLAADWVAVDTGSTDATPALLARAGARILHVPWRDDFAEARNHGLAAARKPWVLLLDADEIIAPADRPRLEAALRQEPRLGYLMEARNYCRRGSHREWQPLRADTPDLPLEADGFFVSRRIGLFPNHPGIRFTGRIHETVLPALQRLAMPVIPLDVPVHHLGYAGPEQVNRDRRDRYRTLVERKLEEDPGDWQAMIEMAGIDLEDGRLPQAQALLERLAQGPRGLRPVVRGTALLAEIREGQGDLGQARELLRDVVRQDPGFLFGWIRLIRHEADGGRWAAAIELLELADGMFPGGEPLILREALRCRAHVGDLAGALAAADALLEICPGWSEIRSVRDRLAKASGHGSRNDEGTGSPAEPGGDRQEPGL
ncbi:glycosyltransferase [bacterium]|nr:glycosyltransferase [bacterium]